MTRSAVLIPVAAGAVDGARVTDLLAALAAHEPLVQDVVIVDDEQPARSFAHPSLRDIPNPRRGRGIPTLGGTRTATLAGLAWIAAHAPGAWVLRLDADALVIGPFAQVVERALDAQGWLRDPRRWLGVGLGDDMVLGAMSRACGLTLVDLPAVFGLTHRGLPDTPQCLLDRHFAIIHSVKNDPAWAEAEVRDLFAAARDACPSPAPAEVVC